jgi:hypothetical protein
VAKDSPRRGPLETRLGVDEGPRAPRGVPSSRVGTRSRPRRRPATLREGATGGERRPSSTREGAPRSPAGPRGHLAGENEAKKPPSAPALALVPPRYLQIAPPSRPAGGVRGRKGVELPLEAPRSPPQNRPVFIRRRGEPGPVPWESSAAGGGGAAAGRGAPGGTGSEGRRGFLLRRGPGEPVDRALRGEEGDHPLVSVERRAGEERDRPRGPPSPRDPPQAASGSARPPQPRRGSSRRPGTVCRAPAGRPPPWGLTRTKPATPWSAGRLLPPQAAARPRRTHRDPVATLPPSSAESTRGSSKEVSPRRRRPGSRRPRRGRGRRRRRGKEPRDQGGRRPRGAGPRRRRLPRRRRRGAPLRAVILAPGAS